MALDKVQKKLVKLEYNILGNTMSERPVNDVTEVRSPLPAASDPDLDAKVAGIIQALGITQNTEEEFLNTLEAELVDSVNEGAGLAVKARQLTAVQSRLQQNIAKKLDPASRDTREQNPYANQAALKEQEFIEKKLQLYKKTQENIREEIERLIAISGSGNISPENALHINRLISSMRSLDQRIDFYTKKDQMLHQQQKEREQSMILANQKKKLAEKIKQDRKALEKEKTDLGKRNLTSFFLPGKWLEVYRNNQKNMITAKEKEIVQSEAQLKTLEKQGKAAETRAATSTAKPTPSSARAVPQQGPMSAASTQPLDQHRRDIPSSTTTTKVAQTKSVIPERTGPVSGKDPIHIPPRTLPQNIIQLQKKDPFADLFANTARGTVSCVPDIQPGKIMQIAEDAKNKRVVAEAAALRTATLQTGTKAKK